MTTLETLGNPAINIAIFVAFVVVTMFVVIRVAQGGKKRASDFYTGGAQFDGRQNGLAIAGDYLSAASFLGIVGAVAFYGYDGLLYSIGFFVAWLVALLLVAEPLRNTGKYTMADVLSFRMRQRPVRMAAATSTLAVSFFYLLAQMAGAGGLVALLLGIESTLGQNLVIAIVGLLMVGYVLIGGMKGTTWVQMIKAVLLIAGAGAMTVWVLALLGVIPVWDERSRRVSGLEVMSLEELGRPRIDVTVRISGFFRDAFPHVIAMIDDAVELVANLDEPEEMNYVRAHRLADLAEHGDERRARTRIFGSKPGSYGAGILQAVESGNWRDDNDLAEIYTAWGGFAYGRGLDGAPARDDMQRNYARIKVAAKNIDNIESDILDSDDYFQYHGGMIATVRALTGAEPRAFVGDSTTPDQVKTRTLSEETARIFRARVVNPRWIAAMQRHGYKGAFELAATVDYLFGFDATAGVVPDWMFDNIAESYVLDENNQAFMRQANPWALRGIIEKLGEAADRGLWEQPGEGLIEAMQQVYLDLEGDLED